MLKKSEKQKIIEDLVEKISKQRLMIFIDITGLKTKELFLFKNNLKKEKNELKVVKKTLFKIALERKGIKIEEKKLEGQLAIIFGYEDEILPAKITYEFSKNFKNLKITGGIINGEFFEIEKIIELANLPSKKELLGKIVGRICAPLTNLINVLQGNIKGLIYALSRFANKKRIISE